MQLYVLCVTAELSLPALPCGAPLQIKDFHQDSPASAPCDPGLALSRSHPQQWQHLPARSTRSPAPQSILSPFVSCWENGLGLLSQMRMQKDEVVVYPRGHEFDIHRLSLSSKGQNTLN